MVRLPSILLSAASLWLCLVPALWADTITINPTADTCLFERDPNNNWGSESEVVSGTLNTGERARALTMFDIAAAVPPGSTITSARLKLRCTRAPTNQPANTSFSLFRVEFDWEEGDKNDGGNRPGGATATAGETTWAARFHSSTLWTSPGGKLEVDFAEDPSTGGVLISGIGNYFFDFNGDGISDLQSMLDTPAGNFGWVLITSNENALKSGRRWAAREHATNAPELEITFTPPAPPAPLEIVSSSLDPDTGLLSVTFDAIGGVGYALDTRPDLASGDWAEAESTVAPSSGMVTITTTPIPGTLRLFFRVRVLAP